jgi:succinate dehydrogenase hydrophobic anchor subunit
MTRTLSIAAFVLGAIIVLWMGSSFMGSNLLAFIVTGVIAIVYVIGFMELMRFQQETRTLDHALTKADEKVSVLDDWLKLLSPALHGSVRLRIKGEYVPLPAPMMTPYLVGLLVMLGLLGTFAGMVDTLKGAVLALEGTNELEAIRAGLSAPIKGLSLAFGTSVAGVSASAMLGFMSTLSRRQRQLSSQLLDGKMMSAFQDFSLAYNREQTFKAMQEQSQSLPVVAEKLASVADLLTHFSQGLSQQLTANQAQFHSDMSREMSSTYTKLASSVDTSLQQSVKDTLENSSRLLGENLQQSIAQLQPIVVDMVKSVSGDMANTQTRLADNIEQQLAKLSTEMTDTTKGMSQTWQKGAEHYQTANENMVELIASTVATLNDQASHTSTEMLDHFGTASEAWLAHQQNQDQLRLAQWHHAFEKTSMGAQETMQAFAANQQESTAASLDKVRTLLTATEQLVEQRIESETQWLDRHDTQVQALTTQLSEQLTALRDEEARRGDTVAEQLKQLSATAAEHLQQLGIGLEAPMAHLIETASETPRAAAEVISQLRAEMTNTMERDNQLLVERQKIFEQLSTVANALEQSSTEQSNTLQTLASDSANTLKDISERFSQQVDTEATRLSNAADHFSGSAVELASVSDAFNTAVEQFSQSTRDVSETLVLIEGSLENSTQRSDEQMGYYVAQAREIIDHTILSQQEMVEQLRQLGRAAPLSSSLPVSPTSSET